MMIVSLPVKSRPNTSNRRHVDNTPKHVPICIEAGITLCDGAEDVYWIDRSSAAGMQCKFIMKNRDLQ